VEADRRIDPSEPRGVGVRVSQIVNALDAERAVFWAEQTVAGEQPLFATEVEAKRDDRSFGLLSFAVGVAKEHPALVAERAAQAGQALPGARRTTWLSARRRRDSGSGARLATRPGGPNSAVRSMDSCSGSGSTPSIFFIALRTA